MDFIITFFRDILDGPLYVVVAIISVILICSCIGYLAEVSLNKKKEKKQYEESHATVGVVNQPVDNSGQVAVSNLDSINPIEVNSGVNNLNSGSVPEVLQQQQQPQASFQQAGVVNQANSLPQQQMNVPSVPTPQPIPQVMQQQVQIPPQSMPQMPPIQNANAMGTAVPVPEVVNTVGNVGEQQQF